MCLITYIERCNDIVQELMRRVQLLLCTSQRTFSAPVALDRKHAVAAVCNTIITRLSPSTLLTLILRASNTGNSGTLVLRILYAKHAFDRFVLRGAGRDGWEK